MPDVQRTRWIRRHEFDVDPLPPAGVAPSEPFPLVEHGLQNQGDRFFCEPKIDESRSSDLDSGHDIAGAIEGRYDLFGYLSWRSAKWLGQLESDRCGKVTVASFAGSLQHDVGRGGSECGNGTLDRISQQLRVSGQDLSPLDLSVLLLDSDLSAPDEVFFDVSLEVLSPSEPVFSFAPALPALL